MSDNQGRCKDCRWWEENWTRPESSQELRRCTNAAGRMYGIVAIDDIRSMHLRVATSADFGCIHFEKKEEQ